MDQQGRKAGMIARGFKSVVWVAAVGGAALGCYMLSLQVATERAELAKVERRIIAAKQEIRTLQTELGTRGRLSQLERWNAEVLALSAPASAQFMQSEFTLARFDRPEPTLEDRAASVVLASAEAGETAAEEKPAPRIAQAAAPQPAPAAEPAALVHQASYAPPPKPAPESRPAPRLDARLADEIHAAARVEKVEKAEGSGGK
jgi:hypothetical protein